MISSPDSAGSERKRHRSQCSDASKRRSAPTFQSFWARSAEATVPGTFAGTKRNAPVAAQSTGSGLEATSHPVSNGVATATSSRTSEDAAIMQLHGARRMPSHPEHALLVPNRRLTAGSREPDQTRGGAPAGKEESWRHLLG